MPRSRGFVIQHLKTGSSTSQGVIIRHLGRRKCSPSDTGGERERWHPLDMQYISNAQPPSPRCRDEGRRPPELRAFSGRSAAALRGVSESKSFHSANEEYVKDFKKKRLGDLQSPPSKKLIIVTCMDARIDPAASLGIKEGDAHIIRNAGGSARDAIRSILVSQHQLGTREIAVFHHTGCGMLTFTSEQFQSQLKEKHPQQAKEIESIDFLTFPELEPSVKADVEYLKQHPLLVDNANITGWVYEVETGKVRQVV